MSRRTSIVTAVVEKMKTIDGTGTFNSDISGNAYAQLKFWDEVNDFPAIYAVAGTETREYHPGGFAWGYLNISFKVYAKGDDSQLLLENLLEDMEAVIFSNRQVVYDSETQEATTEILVTSITTDEGLLAPYAIGEMNIEVRYAITQ